MVYLTKTDNKKGETMQAIMKTDIHLLGTSLKLQAGQRVHLTPATNMPPDSDIKFFARPADGVWSDGMERNEDASIGVNYDDLEMDDE